MFGIPELQLDVTPVDFKRTEKGREGTRACGARSPGFKLTWTLVALRAATEPAKEEAMQAILEVGGGLRGR